jgi:hypothetical protein
VTENHGVGGSIPPLGTNTINSLGPILHFVVRVDNHWDDTRVVSTIESGRAKRIGMGLRTPR